MTRNFNIVKANIVSRLMGCNFVCALGTEDISFFAEQLPHVSFAHFYWGEAKFKKLPNVLQARYDGLFPAKNDEFDALLVSHSWQEQGLERILVSGSKEKGVYAEDDFLPQKIRYAHRLIKRQGLFIAYGNGKFIEDLTLAVERRMYNVQLRYVLHSSCPDNEFTRVILMRTLEEPDPYWIK